MDASAQSQGADNLRAAVTLATDYRSHGLSQTRGDPAWRLALDYEHPTGFFAGGFAANVDYRSEDGRTSGREVLVDTYAGYVRRNARWSASVALAHYAYPGSDLGYDYTQLLVGAIWRDRYFFNAGFTDDWLGLGRRARHYEFGLAWPMRRDLEVSVAAGRYRVTAPFSLAYSHWNAGFSKPAGQFALDLRYHANSYDGWSLLGDTAGDSWVFSLTYALAPR